MYVPAGITKQAEIATSTSAVAKALAPDVVRIRHDIGEDWSGDPAIHFRVILSDSASAPENLRNAMRRVTSQLEAEVKPYELGLIPYFSFRSESEQAELKEKVWA